MFCSGFLALHGVNRSLKKNSSFATNKKGYGRTLIEKSEVFDYKVLVKLGRAFTKVFSSLYCYVFFYGKGFLSS